MIKALGVFKALADETRLRIFNLLMERDCCVCEVMEALDISQTRASRNLQLLHEAGLLRHWKEGLWSHYGIAESAPLDIAPLVAMVRRALEDDLRSRKDISRLAEVVPVECSSSCGRNGNENGIGEKRQ